jgi:FkbH-like protein
MNSKELRTQIEQLLSNQEWAEAHYNLKELWRRDKAVATANYVASCYERLNVHLALTKCRVAILRSMTLEPLLPVLRAAAFVSGVDAIVQLGQFNAYSQELLDTDSWLYSFNPDVIILAIQTRDIAPEIWEGYTDLTAGELDAAVSRVKEAFSAALYTFRQHSNASMIIHNFEKPLPSCGILDGQDASGQLSTIDYLNAELRKDCARHRGVYVLNYDGLIARHGVHRWHDESKWMTMRMPFHTDSFAPLVSEWLKFLLPLTGTTCKALVVDLDDTLWNGVLGEVGPDRIQIGPEYPGALHRSLQRVILDLYHRGILLAVCSKNDHAEALAAIQNHPGMLLRPEHFAAFRINWQDKAQNLKEIASELNIGIEAIAFLDDNPVERERVRQALPEVAVIDLPTRPEGFAQALREFPQFERLVISEEERNHARLYREQRLRSELGNQVHTLEDFYKSLEQEISITPVRPETLARVAQLTQKTNQFNATTRRYTEQQLEDLASRSDWSVYSVHVRDRFGDNGLVGVMITHMEGQNCEIDTFLLSCRVIGRTVETAMLAFLAETGRAEGAIFLRGMIVATKKNEPIRELYVCHKFDVVPNGDGAMMWSLNLTERTISYPEWIHVRASNRVYRPEQATV